MINILLSILQLITIIIISIYEYNHGSIALFLWATILVMFGVPHMISIMTGISNYNDNVMVKASIFVVLFNIFYICSKIILNKFSNKNYNLKNYKEKTIGLSGNSLKKHNKISNRSIKIYFMILILSFLILIFYSIKYLGGISNSSWGGFRKINSEFGFSSLLRYTNFIFFGSSGVVLVYFINKKWVMGIVSLSIVILYALITGNRITILPAVVTMIILYILSDKGKLSFKKVVGFVLMGFFVIYLVYFLRLLRIYGGMNNLINNYSFIELNTQVIDMLLNGNGELGLRNAFYHFIYYNNNFANFNKGHTYIRLLLMIIPTQLIPKIKPPDFAISMGSAWSMNPYNTAFSMHPTLYGDCFANLWWFGIFLGVFWAIFSFIIDKFIYRRNEVAKLMLIVLFGVAYVIAGRGSVYNGLFIAFIGTIIILFINQISRIKP